MSKWTDRPNVSNTDEMETEKLRKVTQKHITTLLSGNGTIMQLKNKVAQKASAAPQEQGWGEILEQLDDLETVISKPRAGILIMKRENIIAPFHEMEEADTTTFEIPEMLSRLEESFSKMSHHFAKSDSNDDNSTLGLLRIVINESTQINNLTQQIHQALKEQEVSRMTLPD